MANKYKIRGVTAEQEKDATRLRRDVRSPLTKLGDWLLIRKNIGIATLALSALIFFIPGLLWPTLLIFLPLLLFTLPDAMQAALPMRVPIHAGVTDYNDPKPGRRGFNKSRGIYFLGNEKFTNKELWAAAPDILTHMLVFGTTGSGKTEFLSGLCTNSVTSGAGVVFVDPKGTNKLEYQIYLLARLMGRDDDFLLLNFSTGGKKNDKYDFLRKSNTTNPLETGTAESLFDMLATFVPTSQGDNAVFSQRALTFMSSILYPLAYLRDQKAINLSVRSIREHLPLRKVMELAGKPQKRPVYGTMIPDDETYPLANYLSSVAGFKDHLPYDRQGDDTMKQHDYAQAYFTRPLASMVDQFGFVYDCDMGEIDYRDVVYNRRIFVILLPAMEKAAPELKQIGNMILSGLKNAIALGLGDKYEGTVEEALDTLPSAAKTPTLMIADEYGYVATEGFAVIPAQARGLGFAFVFAGQDYAGFKRGSETEAEQIVANTKIKVLMTLEDPQTTLKLFQDLAGEGSVTRASGFNVDRSGLSYTYREDDNATIERTSRIDIMDLKGQTEGEFHLFFKEFIIRGQAFHADLTPERYPEFTGQINRFLEVDRPTPQALDNKYGFTRTLKEKVSHIVSGESPPPGQAKSYELENLLAEWRGFHDAAVATKLGRMEAALFGLYAMIHEDDQESSANAPRGRQAVRGAYEGLEDEGQGHDAPRLGKDASSPQGSAYDEAMDDIEDDEPAIEAVKSKDIVRSILSREQYAASMSGDDEAEQTEKALMNDMARVADLSGSKNPVKDAVQAKRQIENALGDYPNPPTPTADVNDISNLVADLLARSQNKQ